MKKYFPYFYFFVNSCILYLLYYPAREGRFVHDFIGWAWQYNHFTWIDILKCKVDHSYHLFYQVFFYSFYKFFHTHATRWLLLFSVLCSGVTTLIFVLFKKILKQANSPHAFGIALMGSLLAMLSPFMDETFAWGATIHYFISAGAMMLAWLLIIKYVESNRLKFLIGATGLYFIAMFSLEIAFVFPFIIAVYLFFCPKTYKVSIRQSIYILLPQFFIIALYFILNIIIKGTAVGHYGAAVHLNLSPPFLASQFACYLAKYLAFEHFRDFPERDKVYPFLQRNEIGYLLFTILYILPIIIFFIRFKRMHPVWRVGFVLYFITCFALLPTQNLYFMYLFRTENDRMGYFFSLFLFMGVSYLFIRYLKWVGYLILIVYGIIGIHYLKGEIGDWKQTGDVVRTLTNEYTWQNNKGKVHILCLGDNMNGVYLFKNYKDTTFFSEYYEVMKSKHPSNLQQYMYWTMFSENDQTNAYKINDSTIQVDLLSGGWLMNNGLGAIDYETTDASIKVNQQKSSYKITFKNKQPDDVYIYESGLHWKQVNDF